MFVRVVRPAVSALVALGAVLIVCACLTTLVGLLLVILAGLAHAAEPAAAPTLVESLQPIVGTIVAAAVTAFCGWLWVRLEAFFGVKIDAGHRDALQSALTTGANLIIARAAVAGSREVAVGLEHVKASVPDAIAHFGVSTDRIATMLTAKVQQLDPPLSALVADQIEAGVTAELRAAGLGVK